MTEDGAGRIRAVGHVNVGSYERDLSRRFTARQLGRLYERNPAWAEIERRIYGDVLLRD